MELLLEQNTNNKFYYNTQSNLEIKKYRSLIG